MALVNARMYEQLEEKAQYLQQEVERRHQLGDLFGQSDAMQAIYRFIDRAAKSDVPVLVQGETGTAKNWLRAPYTTAVRAKTSGFVAKLCHAITRAVAE